MSVESTNIPGDGAKANSGFERKKNDRDAGAELHSSGEEESDCDSDDCEDDVPELVELNQTLDYLISRNSKQCDPGTAGDEVEGNDTCDENTQAVIPNLVNRILMEHYSRRPSNTHIKYNSSNTQGCDNNKGGTGGNKSCDAKGSDDDETTISNENKRMTRVQKEKMTLYLTAVIVEFAQPHFVKVMRYKEQLQQAQQQQQRQTQKDGRANGDGEANDSTQQKPAKRQKQSSQQPPASSPKKSPAENTVQKPSTLAFDERAISWATQCLKKLLQPLPYLMVSCSSQDSFQQATSQLVNQGMGKVHNNVEETHIPELDALLAATGSTDGGMEMEKKLQSALLGGFQGRRMIGCHRL